MHSRDLTWGLKDEAIEGRWLWGARAIYDGGNGPIDLLHDRQAVLGDVTDRDIAEVNVALGLLRARVRDRPLPASRPERVTVETDAVVLHADTRGSHGYLYVTAQPRED